jgi:hypothetical protein
VSVPGKYDDYDYHIGAAIEAGFEPDNAFTHIGFMVSWLIRRGLFQTEFTDPEAGEDLETGKLRPSDLRDLVDGKLIDNMLTSEGAAFLDTYYQAYLTDYDEAFAKEPDYGVTDDLANQARVDDLVNAAFKQWVTTGRPFRADLIGPETQLPGSTDGISEMTEMVFEYSGPPELMAGMQLPPGVKVVYVDRHLHEDPALEKLITDAIPIPLDTDASKGTQWGSSLLRRQLRDLGVKPKDVVVASGMAANAHPTLTVVRIPGVGRARIFEVFRQDRSYARKLDWHPCQIAAWAGLSCTDQLPALPLDRSIWFAMDGYSVDIGSTADDPRLFEFAEALARALTR